MHSLHISRFRLNDLFVKLLRIFLIETICTSLRLCYIQYTLLFFEFPFVRTAHLLHLSFQVKRLVSGTFKEFLDRNNLDILAPLFYMVFTAQGYGHIDEIAALYGLMWNTPKMMQALVRGLEGREKNGTNLKSRT